MNFPLRKTSKFFLVLYFPVFGGYKITRYFRPPTENKGILLLQYPNGHPSSQEPGIDSSGQSVCSLSAPSRGTISRMCVWISSFLLLPLFFSRLFLCSLERIVLSLWKVLYCDKCTYPIFCFVFSRIQYICFQSTISNDQLVVPFAAITAVKKKLSKWLVHDSLEISHQKFNDGDKFFPPQVNLNFSLFWSDFWQGVFLFIIF